MKTLPSEVNENSNKYSVNTEFKSYILEEIKILMNLKKKLSKKSGKNSQLVQLKEKKLCITPSNLRREPTALKKSVNGVAVNTDTQILILKRKSRTSTDTETN